MGRGKDSPEIIPYGGNKGRNIEKDRRGQVEDRGELGMVASMQTGHLD
jgi:hypothetical protein